MKGEQALRRAIGSMFLGIVWFVSGSLRADEDPRLYPRSLGETKAMIQILACRKGPGATVESEFLSRLRQYRYLSGVPFEDLGWGSRESDLALHAAQICAKLNKMTHIPERPAGMSDAEYELCRTGAGQSNLYTGRTGAAECVDGWMDDSDEKNIDRVGHRRWCLNPSMQRSAFAATGNFAAMYAFDKSNKNVPDWDVVCYPSRGYMPLAFFSARAAWSVSLNMRKFAPPVEREIKVTIQPVDLRHQPLGPALKLDYFRVELGGFGSGPAIIFRPAAAGFALEKEGLYQVEIAGLKTSQGQPAPLQYEVRFINLQKVPDGPELAPASTKYFQRRLAWIEEMPEKLDQLDALLELSDQEYLRVADAAVRSSLHRSLAELLKDPALKRERDASLRYRQVALQEQKAGKGKNALSQVAVSYRELSQAYKETRAGKRALEDFERLRNQLE